MHSFASQETSSTESFQSDKKSHITCMYLPCCVVKRVADTFVEVSLVLGFGCWLTPIPLTVLCVSTCCDGLLDFHTDALRKKREGGLKKVPNSVHAPG